MPYVSTVLLSYSIFIVVAVLLLRRRYLPAAMLPFALLIMVGATNEIVSTVQIASGNFTCLNNNIYLLLEAALLLWLFRQWGAIAGDRTLFFCAGVLLFAGWLLELLMADPDEDLVFFGMCYSFGAVVLAVRCISEKQLPASMKPYESSVLLIGSGFIIYFSCRILLDSAWYLGLTFSPYFQHAVFDVMACINCIVNLCYALAILWIRPKQKFSSLLY